MSKMDPRIASIIEMIERDCTQRFTVSRVAAQLRLSRSRFEHLFKEQTCKTFKSHLRKVRVARAKSLLTDRCLSIKEVAVRCGYLSATGLSRDFRRIVHSSPSNYRRSTFCR